MSSKGLEEPEAINHGDPSKALASRLSARREEIEAATLARLTAVSPLPERGAEPGYAEGLRAAVAAAVGQALETLAGDGAPADGVPEALLFQARLAARSGVGLDTVARRYVAGHGLISRFLLREAAGAVPPGDLAPSLHGLSLTLDRLLSAATAAYTAEAEQRGRSPDQNRLRQIERLLSGDILDADGLAYDLDLFHLGVLVGGAGGRDLLRSLAAALDTRLLAVSPTETLHWAWLGRRNPLDPDEVHAAAHQHRPPSGFVALGEPASGAAGWRFTHRQARAALAVALRQGPGVFRYADVALVASIGQDDLLVTSLRNLYLMPLEGEANAGTDLHDTVEAFLATGLNVSSAAAKLGISRHTVTNRLRVVEERLGRPLAACRTELDLVLRLRERVRPPFSQNG